MKRETVVLIGLGVGVLAAAALMALEAMSDASEPAGEPGAKRPVRAPP